MQTLSRLLRNPYFFGVVPYRGIYYEGKYEPLITAETWLRIQDVLKSHDSAGEKTRKHPHYLKGTIWCSECGSRLIYTRHRGGSGLAYEYFACITRKTKRRVCSRTGTPIYKIEAGIADFYQTFQLATDHAEAIRDAVRQELDAERETARIVQDQATQRVRAATNQRDKLLQAYYAGALPDDHARLRDAAPHP